MSKKKTSPTTLWFLYPVFGLEITDKEDDLDSPMFEDATIISKRHLMKILKGRSYIAEMFTTSSVKENVYSFLAVRRTFRLPSKMIDHDRYDKESAIEEDASKRAHQLAALIGLSFLAEGRTSFSLAEHRYQAGRKCLVLNVKDRSCSMTSKAKGLTLSSKPQKGNILKLTRNRLSGKFNRKPSKWLAEVLIPTKPRLGDSLTKAIVQSAIRLSIGTHVSLPSSQILAGVTGMELLVSEGNDKFKVVQNRVEALVGANVADKYGIDDIFKARNKYVHEGEDLSLDSTSLSWNSALLGLVCLLNYSKIAPMFPSKHDLVRYLDFVRLSSLFSFSSPKCKTFKVIPKYKPMKLNVVCFKV